MQRTTYFVDEFKKIVDLHEQGGQDATMVREAGRLFEELLRDLIAEYLPKVAFRVRKAIFDAETEIGKGTKGMGEFHFGQLVGILRTTKMLDAIAEVDGRSTRSLHGIDLSFVCDLRNSCVHGGATPSADEVEYVLSALRTFLAYFGVDVAAPARPLRSITDVSNLLQERFASVEVIEGTVAFYRRLTEIVRRPEIDRYDLTYLVDHPPRAAKSRVIQDYWATVRSHVLGGEARLRRIVTFNNPPKAAWILFNLVAGHAKEFDEGFVVADFEWEHRPGKSDVMVPNLALYYSNEDPTDGFAWIYSHQIDDHEHFICVSGKAAFPTMRHVYASWFRSCERLTMARAATQFRKFFGPRYDEAAVREALGAHREAVAISDEDARAAVDFWVRKLDEFPG